MNISTLLSSIMYISPALLFNKIFLKLYIYSYTSIILMYSVLLLIDTIINRVVLTLNLTSYFRIDLLIVNYDFVIRSSTSIMLVIISLISSYIHIYSLDYMIGDVHQNQFVTTVELFALTINVLVMSNNMIIFFFS